MVGCRRWLRSLGFSLCGRLPVGCRIHRSKHGLEKSVFSSQVQAVIQILNECGFEAYLVGGAIRDQLAGVKPTDEDVVTNANPEQIRYIFKKLQSGFHCYIVGRRHRLVHVSKDGVTIEVSTFSSSGKSKPMIPGITGRLSKRATLTSDACRRDLTVNALYYCPAQQEIIDLVGGFNDIKKGLLRVIGDPMDRFSEDPVRILRALCLSSKLKLSIDKETKKAIDMHKNDLTTVSKERLFLEMCKLFYRGHGQKNYQILRQYQILEILFPQSTCVSDSEQDAFYRQAFFNSDRRFNEDLTLSPVFLFAILLWHPFKKLMGSIYFRNKNFETKLEQALQAVCQVQKQRVAMSQKLILGIKDIYRMQYAFMDYAQLKQRKYASHMRFRASLDFLVLRAQLGEVNPFLVIDWVDYRKQNGSREKSRK